MGIYGLFNTFLKEKIMQIRCTPAQAEALLAARDLPSCARKAKKRAIFAQIHADHNLPARPKFVLFIENPANPLYCVLRDKQTKVPLDDGRIDTPVAAPTVETKVPLDDDRIDTPVAAPVVETAAKPVKAVAKKKAAAKPAAKATAKKPAPKKAVAKPAPKKAVAKPAPKKAVAKPAAKAIAKPAKKVAVKVTGKAPAKAKKATKA